jgi:hypothetical protein
MVRATHLDGGDKILDRHTYSSLSYITKVEPEPKIKVGVSPYLFNDCRAMVLGHSSSPPFAAASARPTPALPAVLPPTM